jgi:hypothetical protein
VSFTINPHATPCPRCKGSGTIGAFLDGSSGGWYDPALQCLLCKGLGAIDPQQQEWLRVGGTHRTWRVAQFESILECATRLGVTPAELSAMEHGRANPFPLLLNDTPEVLRNVP